MGKLVELQLDTGEEKKYVAIDPDKVLDLVSNVNCVEAKGVTCTQINLVGGQHFIVVGTIDEIKKKLGR